MALFKRGNQPPELQLPTDYQPVDYTSLPLEDNQGMSTRNKLMIGVGALAIVGALAALFFFLTPGDDPITPLPTPRPAYAFGNVQAELVRNGSDLEADLRAMTSNIPEGSDVRASVLEDGQPFALWETASAVAPVEANRVRWTIPVERGFPQGTEGAAYQVLIETEIDGQVVSATGELEISTSAAPIFFTQPEPTAAPVPPTATPPTTSAEATAVPPPPTSAPTGPAGPVDAVAQGAGTLYLNPFGPSGVRGQVGPGEGLTVVARLFQGNWYLVASPTATGWLDGALLDLGSANVPVTGGPDSRAAVFNGGNVRAAPVTGGVVATINAGETVDLLARNADGTWVRITTPAGVSGWVSAQLLTIDPAVAGTLPVQ